MSEPHLSDEQLARLRKLAEVATPAPWRSMIEGRDHSAGDNFIMRGGDSDRRQDLYLNLDGGTASPTDHDFIAAARNFMVPLLDEIERLRREIKGLRTGIHDLEN